MTTGNKVALIVLDGWGLAPEGPGNAVRLAATPVMDDLLSHQPSTQLSASGEDVGLPPGQMGNSEVGHLNLGAGRIVWQELANISRSIRSGDFNNLPEIQLMLNHVRSSGGTLHLMGLVSDGGVHSHIDHLLHLCRLVNDSGIRDFQVHAFTDGRDTDPKSGLGFLTQLQETLQTCHGKLATVVGRYFAMDRDKRWERVRIAYDALTKGEGESSDNAITSLANSYNRGITDEFIQPIIANGSQRIKDGDTILCFNFRTDRCREITEVLTQCDMPEFGMKKLSLHYVTMTRYDNRYEGVRVIFEKYDLADTLGEVLSNHGITQHRIAETEKYPHVTFFFSGGREAPFDGEERSMVPSPRVATYDQAPEMSADSVCETAMEVMIKRNPGFLCLNFANPDMVGHTGSLPAAITAIETVDACLGKLIDCGLPLGYTFVVLADHGNAECMLNDDGSPHTAHTTNSVPCILVSNEPHKPQLAAGRLADIAPTILDLFQLPKPISMNGASLLRMHQTHV
jgi:2,3-bisphosphoglycerate-independent phosphoglycerate mutase